MAYVETGLALHWRIHVATTKDWTCHSDYLLLSDLTWSSDNPMSNHCAGSCLYPPVYQFAPEESHEDCCQALSASSRPEPCPSLVDVATHCLVGVVIQDCC